MIELTNHRRYDSKRFDNEDGTNTSRVYCAPVHYKDDQGNFQDTDIRFEDSGSWWSVTKANYHLYVIKNFDSENVVRYDNKYDGCNHTIYLKPHSLRWVNKTDFSDMQLFRNAQPVTGTLVDDQTIRFTDAFGDGLHLEIVLLANGFRKELVIDTKNKLENPPTPDHKLVLFSKYTGSGLRVKANDKAYSWDGIEYYDSLEGFDIEELTAPERKTLNRPARITDANDNFQVIKQFWGLHSGAMWQAKVLPTQYLQNASYPVRTDATFNAVASGDGDIYYVGSTSWDEAHDSGSGTARPTYVTPYACRLSYFPSGYEWIFIRSFWPFDTSSIPDSATITACTLNLYWTVNLNNINDGRDYIAIVQSTQASPTGLVDDDYDELGTTDGGHLDQTGIPTSQYNAITLNSSYYSWINKTGYTKLATRYGWDLEDVEPSVEEESWITAYSSDNASNKPYLDVTWSVPGSPIMLHHYNQQRGA